MELRVLGPVEASVEGHGVALAGPKQRLVLAHLVIEANRVVSTDRLIDRIWGEDPPEGARGALQSYVSRLRRSLGPAVIEARPPGYQLRAHPDDVDSIRFERIAAEARGSLASDPAAAESLLKQALALWRGPAFADLADDPSLRSEITRLEELRLRTIEDRVEARLALGRHADLVPELEVLVAEHPLRERLWGNLMLALYRTGRQGDALGAYRRARQILADQLGVDPTTELQQQHERILRHDPTLEVGGRALRGYELFEVIGRGAIGTVHRASQPEVGREVAVTVIHPWLADDPAFIRGFEHEAQRVARLEHPHIVPLYDYWRDPGGAYLVMRYVRGGNLRTFIENHGPMEPGAALILIDQLASALAAAHRQGVVHRAIHPTTVLLDDEGNAYLSDLGFGRNVVATEAFAEGSEHVGDTDVSLASDVRGLGLLTFELLAARPPSDEAPAAPVRADRAGPLPSLAPIRPDLPSAVDDVLRRATAEDPAMRYPDASSYAAALRFSIEVGAELTGLPILEAVNPFKGLRPYQEADASDFFGREAATAQLVARLGEATESSRFLAVVGPSGSGKSSVVRAGLIPVLRRGALPGSDRWFVVDMHPGTSPYEELETALLSIAVSRPASLLEELERDDRGLLRAAERVLPPGDGELLILIDQFEELFTLVPDAERRRSFLEVVRTAVLDPASRVRVVLALRADFYDRPLLYRTFGDLLGLRTFVLTGLSPEDIERAVLTPTERAGVRVEPGLIAEIATQVTDRPSALPLFQYALTELFDRRTDAGLTLDAYHHVGGVLGALGRRAERLYGRLDDAGKQAARQIFLRLVMVGDGGSAETRRRVPRSELTDLEVDDVAMEHVLSSFDAYRLLSFDRDPVTRGPTVEVAHESLLTGWERLRGWIEVARDDVRMHRRLAAATAEWEGAGRERGYLFRGAQLDLFEGWAAGSGLALTAAERRYLEAGTAQRESERINEQRRRARETIVERRSRIRLRALVAVLALAAVVASTLTAITLGQRESARAQARVATARELAAAALANLEVDPELSILLALEAVRATRAVDGTVLPEAHEVLHTALTSSRIVTTIRDVRSIDWGSSGEVAVVREQDPGVVRLLTRAGDPIRSWKADRVQVSEVVFSTDGSTLATAGASGIKLWHPATGGEVLQLQDQLAGASGLSFSEDDGSIAAIRSGVVGVWDLASGRRVGSIVTGGLSPPVIALGPDGSTIAVARGTTVRIVDVSSGRLLRVLREHVFDVTDVDWHPAGTLLATSELDPTVRVWNATSGRLVHVLAGGQASDWSSDGSRLTSGGKVWEIRPGEGARSVGDLFTRERIVTEASFGPDPSQVLTAEEDGSARIWDLGLSGDAEWLNLEAQPDWNSDVTFSPDGRWLLGSVPDSTVRVWNAESGMEELTLAGHDHPGSSGGMGVAGVAASSDGRLIATAGRDDTVRIWRAVSGTPALEFEGHSEWVEEVRFSPDGKLLATVSLDSTARIIDVAGGKELRSVSVASTPEPAFSAVSIQFTPDGRSIITGSWDGSLRVFDVGTGAERDRFDVGTQIDNIAIDGSGDRVAVATGDRTILWSLRTGEPIASLARPAFAIAFGPDGDHVALGSDGLVTLWNVEAGTTVALRGHTGFVTAVAFSPDGSRLASLGTEGTIRVWATTLDDLILLAREELTRSFTREECRQYLHVDRCPSRD